jgi:hypothetical protein
VKDRASVRRKTEHNRRCSQEGRVQDNHITAYCEEIDGAAKTPRSISKKAIRDFCARDVRGKHNPTNLIAVGRAGGRDGAEKLEKKSEHEEV